MTTDSSVLVNSGKVCVKSQHFACDVVICFKEERDLLVQRDVAGGWGSPVNNGRLITRDDRSITLEGHCDEHFAALLLT